MIVYCKKDFYDHKVGVFCDFQFKVSYTTRQFENPKKYDGAVAGLNHNRDQSQLWRFISDEQFKEHYCTEQEIRKLKLERLRNEEL